MRMTASWFGSNAIHRIQGCCGAWRPTPAGLRSSRGAARSADRPGGPTDTTREAVMTSPPTADSSAVLDAVQDASRRLRRCRKRHPGQRSARGALLVAGRDEGMAATVEQRDEPFKQPTKTALTTKPPYKGARRADEGQRHGSELGGAPSPQTLAPPLICLPASSPRSFDKLRTGRSTLPPPISPIASRQIKSRHRQIRRKLGVSNVMRTNPSPVASKPRKCRSHRSRRSREPKISMKSVV